MSWDLEKAHESCKGNQMALKNSDTCACFYCRRVFSPADIEKWIDRKAGRTATCPNCFVDAVLASSSGWPIDERTFLDAMHERWFSRPTKLTRAELTERLDAQKKGAQG